MMLNSSRQNKPDFIQSWIDIFILNKITASSTENEK